MGEVINPLSASLFSTTILKLLPLLCSVSDAFAFKTCSWNSQGGGQAAAWRWGNAEKQHGKKSKHSLPPHAVSPLPTIPFQHSISFLKSFIASQACKQQLFLLAGLSQEPKWRILFRSPSSDDSPESSYKYSQQTHVTKLR